MFDAARHRGGPDRGSNPAADPVAAEIERLASLDLPGLRVQFRNHTGRIAPARVSRPLLLRVLAYRIQADAHGDLRPDTRRLLARMAEASTAANGATKRATEPIGGVAPAAVPIRPAPQRGTVLLREWQGRMERVSVGQGGYDWNGTTYPSLSAAAKAITGTKWNGRRFFGLDRPAATAGARR